MRTAYTAKGLLPSQQPCFIFRLFGASAGLIITLKLELAVVHAENTVCTVGDSKVVGNHDEGQTDMVEAVKAYYDVGFEGVSRPDHVPTMYGDDNSSPSYGINGNLFALGYMKGIIETVEKERGIFQK